MKSNKMHQRFGLAAVVALLCVAMAVPMALAQSPDFNNGSLKGSYGFLVAKWTSDSSTNATNSLGLMTFDGAGNVSGSGTHNEAGNVSTFTFSGTYSVEGNGTGSMSFTVNDKLNVTMAFVIDASTKNIQLLETDCSEKPCDSVTTGTAIAQVSTSFNNSSLKGVFGWLTNEWTSDPNQSAEATVGVATFDGAGNIKAVGTDNTAGTLTNFKDSGTYTVNSDGTGSYTITNSKGQATDGAFVINAAGKGFQYILTTPCGNSCPNAVWSGTATHQ